MADDLCGKVRISSFSYYLRTGRHLQGRVATSRIEAKYNPWHDPEDGKFTFAGAGRFFGPGSPAGPSSPRFAKPPGQVGGGGTSRPRRAESEPGGRDRDAESFTQHVVKPGDSLSRIAMVRRGLTARQLAALNGIDIKAPLRPGQRLRMPSQAWLNTQREAAEKYARVQAHQILNDGKLPIPKGPGGRFRDINVADLPSIDAQAAAIKQTAKVHGYNYAIDHLLRTRRVDGYLSLGPTAKRYPEVQKRAGGKDRLPTDHGGHFIAARFNGPGGPVNIFAQDANFNLSAYKKMENRWSDALKAGKRVRVDIRATYSGISTRPDAITVIWYVNGKRRERSFSNRPKGK